MKQLTAKQMLEAFDRALAEAARIAARREAELASRDRSRTSAAEDPAKYEPGKR